MRFWAVAALALLGCGEDAPSADTSGGGGSVVAACVPGQREVAGLGCLDAGIADDGCPAGEIAAASGGCRAAGIPAERCGAGFTPDADAGCVPQLPEAPCGAGTMAVPGETRCRPIAACGSGTWGDVPSDGAVQRVDQSYAGADSDGSAERPWTTIQAGIDAAAAGAVVAVAAGSYAEDLYLSDPVVLWGRCPDQVEVVGTGARLGTVTVYGSQDDPVEIRGLAITGAAIGVLMGEGSLVLDEVWVHDTTGPGVDVEDASGPSIATVRNSLVESASEAGVFAWGSAVHVERSVIRGTRPQADGRYGRGLSAYTDPNTRRRASASVVGTVVEDNHEVGVFANAADVIVEGSVVRRTAPQVSDGIGGRGINAQVQPATGLPSTLQVLASVVEQNHDIGVFVGGSEATLEATVVARTQPVPETGDSGRGIEVAFDPDSGARSAVTVRDCLIDANREIGVNATGGDLVLEGTAVRGTLPRLGDGRFGRGVEVKADAGAAKEASALVRGCAISSNHDAGVALISTPALIEGTAVRDTQRVEAASLSGRGIGVEHLTGSTFALGPEVTLRGVVVERSTSFGVTVVLSPLVMEGTRISDAFANDGLYGDGLAISLGAATVASSVVERSARANLSAFGSEATVEGSALLCAPIVIHGADHAGHEYRVEDLGGNACGCESPSEADCAVKTFEIEPPPDPAADG